MTDVPDPAHIIEAAHQAAAAGDYPEAERLLRRAHAIAVASLSPGHPFIATSLKNLVDFCAAHKIPIWKPPTVRSDDDTSSPEPDAEAQPEPMLPVYRPGRAWPPRTIALATLGVAVVVAVAFAVQGRGTSDSPATSATTPALTGKPQPTITLERRADSTPAPVERPKSRETSITSASVSVLNAQLCSALEKEGSPDWQCTSVNDDPQPGTYIFYTRLLTNADTTVEHRWYRGERVHQVMRLRVAASPGRGYRTFSSNTISPARAGDWKVELRAADGTLLREEHFVIR